MSYLTCTYWRDQDWHSLMPLYNYDIKGLINETNSTVYLKLIFILGSSRLSRSSETMELYYSCDLCKSSAPIKHCDICHISMCEVCVEKHLPDSPRKHSIVPFKRWEIYPICIKHSTKVCTEICKTCHILVCPLCADSKEHKQHEKEDILKRFERKKETNTKWYTRIREIYLS